MSLTLTSMLAKHPDDANAVGALEKIWLNYGALRQLSVEVRSSLRANGISAKDRVAIVLPNGDAMASAFITIAQAKKKKNKINLFYNSNNYERDFVYVGDICQVHYKMLKVKKSGLFNIGRGKSLSFEQIAKEVAKKFKCEINYIKMPDNVRKHYQKFTRADISKLKKLISITWTDPIDYIKKLKRIY